jgi:hypothetical protein
VIRARKAALNPQNNQQQERLDGPPVEPLGGREQQQGQQQRKGRDILGYLLSAQQQQGGDVITDDMVADEMKTMMFAGAGEMLVVLQPLQLLKAATAPAWRTVLYNSIISLNMT